jgi:hypothetical protein
MEGQNQTLNNRTSLNMDTLTAIYSSLYNCTPQSIALPNFYVEAIEIYTENGM